MIKTIPISKKEFDDARKEEAALRGELVTYRFAVIDKCRREGFTHAGHFFFIEVVGWYYKTDTVDHFVDLEKINE